MENPKNESLVKLLDFIEELCSKEENIWFKTQLISRINPEKGFENFPSFLKFQKKQFRLKGRHFYSSLESSNFKNDLINDFVEMSWYQSINSIERFVLFTFYQMENLLNYYALNSNVYNKVKTNMNHYVTDYGNGFKVVVYDNLFYKGGNTKEIEKVSIWAKITYWVIDANLVEWENINHNIFSNMISIRNANSHRNSYNSPDKDSDTVSYLKKSDLASHSFYISVIKKIINSLVGINQEVKIIAPIYERPKLKGLTQVGKIDLDQFKK